MRSIFKLTLLFTFLFTISACGNKDGDSTVIQEILSGHFITGPIEGLRFETSSQSGKTNSQGKFSYLGGEQIRFYVGDILLAEVEAKPEISLFDLAGVDPLYQGSLDEFQDELLKERLTLRDAWPAVVNLAIFLFTLDDDANPDNGILLEDKVHTASGDLPVHFYMASKFFNQGTFNVVLSKAEILGLGGGERPMFKPHAALARLYQISNLELRLRTLTSIEIDLENDGITNRVAYLHYDENGKMTSRESDSNNDEMVDYKEEYYYDNKGRKTKIEIDQNNDELVDQIFTRSFDAFDNRISERNDVDTRTVSNSTQHRFYDEHNRLMQLENDFDGDSLNEQVIKYYYNSFGVLASEELYLDNGETLNARRHYAYDHTTDILTFWIDQDADEIVDFYSLSAYNQNGNLLRYAEGPNQNASVLYYEYQYDDIGRVVRYLQDNYANGTIDKIVNHAYLDTATQSRYGIDSNNDLIADYEETKNYNESYQLTSWEIDNNADGIVDSFRQYSYTEDALSMTIKNDIDGNLVFDNSTRYHYETLPVSWWNLFHPWNPLAES
ncbi:MAG: hypothetical protein OEY38_09915 [Gammaproteobacteria bacterium]|nr:hypothetical protein [Gammaproteobacteria bacterium]